jgi:AMP nucleosidase
VVVTRGGLRESQLIGDYVLAHAYLRDDHVLDAVCRRISQSRASPKYSALYDRRKEVSGMPEKRLNSACAPVIVTTDDRNWELRYSASALRFNLSRAVAIDMESATIAAQELSLPRPLRHAAVRLR